MTRPLVSILIPAYNAEQWICDALRSALAQTWAQKEIIVVDDGSTDRTLEIARQFESERLQVVANPHCGAAATRNKALLLSKGEYIQYLDADDVLAPDKIEKQMLALGESPNKRALVSGSFGKFMYRYYRTSFIPTALWCDLSPIEWLIRKMQLNLFMQTGTWLVSRELAEAAGPWDTRLLGDDDGEYFCRVLLASDEVRFVPDAKVYYREAGPGRLSYIGQSDRKMIAQWISMELHIRYIRSLEDSERVRAACVNYLQNWVHFFHPDMPDLVRRAEEMARSLGGELRTPKPSWKLSVFSVLFGEKRAKGAQVFLTKIKWFFMQNWDKMLFQFENRRIKEGF